MKKNHLTSLLSKEGYVAIPISKNHVGHYELEVKMNSKPFNMILDTGASGSVLDIESSKNAGFKLTSTKKESGCVGGVPSKIYELSKMKLEIDDYQINNFKIMAVDFSHINNAMNKEGANKIDGVLGVDLLTKYSALIDYKSSTLFLMN